MHLAARCLYEADRSSSRSVSITLQTAQYSLSEHSNVHLCSPLSSIGPSASSRRSCRAGCVEHRARATDRELEASDFTSLAHQTAVGHMPSAPIVQVPNLRNPACGQLGFGGCSNDLQVIEHVLWPSNAEQRSIAAHDWQSTTRMRAAHSLCHTHIRSGSAFTNVLSLAKIQG